MEERKAAELKKTLLTTLKLQPVVMLYSLVSVSSKLASRELPKGSESLLDFVIKCITNPKLIGLYALMLGILMVYAVIWQKMIKNVKITVMYANKSSYIFWTQIAAVTLFREKLDLFNVLGIVVIFIGILVVNKHE